MSDTHKLWGFGAFACMTMAMISGAEKELRDTHKYWAMGAFGCMTMAMLTGHAMVSRKPKKPAGKIPENKENTKTEEIKGDKKMDKYVCGPCGYEYDPEVGDPDNGIAPGTPFEDLPDDWVCPVCGVGKDQFEKA